MTATLDPSTRTMSGQTLLILDTEIDPDHPGSLDVHAVHHCRSWFEDRGFRVAQDGTSGVRLIRSEVEVLLGIAAGMLTEVIFTFTLSRKSPDQLAEWAKMIEELGPILSLTLVDCQTQQPVTLQNFATLIRSQANWAEAAGRWGWVDIKTLANA